MSGWRVIKMIKDVSHLCKYSLNIQKRTKTKKNVNPLLLHPENVCGWHSGIVGFFWRLWFLGNSKDWARRSHLNKPCHGVMGFPEGSDGKESACNAGDQVQSLDWEDLLEKGMSTHSNILEWRIPWTEEPDGLHSIGSQSWTWLNDFRVLTLAHS